MPRFDDSDDEFYSSDDDVYDELENDTEFDDEEPTVKCSHCGCERLEIVYQCPRCGEIPTREFREFTTQPLWIVITALILLGILLWGIFLR